MNLRFFLDHPNKVNFLYRGFTLKYWKELPVPVATMLRMAGMKQGVAGEHVPLNTYDGSGQCTHPDVLRWKDKLWLVCTPYPYACAKYENPCLYCGNDLTDLKPLPGMNPMGRPTGNRTTDYCSDPAMIVYRERLMVFWRDTYVDGNGNLKEKLAFRETADGINWSQVQTAYENSCDKQCPVQLSPAFLNQNDECLYRISVRKTRAAGGDIEWCSSENGKDWTSPTAMTVEGLPEGYDLWHIGIAAMDAGKNIRGLTDKLTALFLLRCIADPDRYALVYAQGDLSSGRWQVKDFVSRDQMERSGVYPYKSAFLPDGRGVIYGAVDSKNRWYLCADADGAKNCFGGE